MVPAAAIRITEERTFSAELGGRTITGLAVASAWEGFTKYTDHHGSHLIVLDAEQRVITGAGALLAKLGLDEPEIGDHFDGGIYAGRTEVDGKPARLILMPGEAVDVSWPQAVDWAMLTAAGSLPTREEQRILFDNLKSEFHPTWYWSGEQHASNPSYAWGQGFDDGYQDYFHKSDEGRARAVRRLPI